MEGYIKLSRRFFDNKIWQAARAFSESEAWIDLIQAARFEAQPTTSRIGSYEVTWSRGQYPASNRFLAKRWNRSERWVKTFMGMLKREGMITTDNSQGLNVITLLNFEKYNGNEDEEKPPSGPLNGPPNGPLSDPLNAVNIRELQTLLTHLAAHLPTHQATHPSEKRPTCGPNNKKDKEIYKETSTDVDAKKAALSLALSKRRNDFLEILRPYVGIYGRDMMNDFFAYWTEPNKSGTKMRFELERTWDVGRRLKRWANHENQYSKSYGTNRENNQTAEQRAYGAAQIVAELLAEDDART